MNWLKRLFGKRKSAAEQQNTPTPAAPATAETPAPSTAESAPEAATDIAAAPEAADTAADTEAAAAAETAADTAAAAPTSTSEPSASEPAAAESEPVPAADESDATDPAMSVLDDVERAAELQTATPEAAESAQDGPYGPASAKPASDGAPPSAEFTIKGKESSKLFHTEESPYFGRTKADVWFKSAADAESAGFTAYARKKATAKK